MAYGSLVIKFAADLAEFQRDVRRSTALVERELNGIKKTAQTFQRAFQAALIGTGAVTAVRAIVREVSQAEESEKRLAATIKATGDVTGFTTAQLNKMNAEMALLTRFDDESIRNAQANLASFGNISEDVFERALKLSADLAERLGTDVADAATVLGKALTDTGGVDSIARGIVKLTEAEKDRAKELLRLNDLQGYQNLLLTIAEGKIGGTAEAMNTGILKQTADLTKAWNDLLEEVGKTGVFERITRTLEGAASLIRDIRLEIEGLPNTLRKLNLELADFVTSTPLRFTFAGPAAKKIQEEARTAVGKIKPAGEAEDRAASEQAAKERAAAARASAQAEEEARRRKEIAKATAGTRISIAISEADRIADEEEKLAKTRLDILDRFHAEGLVDEQEYWNTRLGIQQQAIQAQITAADAEIAQRRKALAIAGQDAAVSGAGAVAYLNAQKDLAVALDKRADLEREIALVAIQGNLDARASANQYRDAIADVNAQLLELQGRSEEAAAIRFEQQTRSLRARAANDPAGLASIDALGKATVAQARFNDVQRRAEIIQRDLSMQEERIHNSREVGAISEIRSLQETSEARRNSLAELEAIGREMQRVADESGNVFLVQQAQAFRLEIEKLAGQTDLLADRFDKIGETAFSDFLTDLLDGTKSVKDAFKDMADSILKQVNRLAAEEIATKIFGGGAGQQGGFGFGGFMSKLFSGVLGTGGAASGGAGLIDAFVGLASGGPARAGRPYLVGEEGPELFVPDTSGTVVPNGGSMGGGRIMVSNYFQVSGPIDRRSQDQIALAAGRGVNRAITRNG